MSTHLPPTSEFKSRAGIKRIANAARYSWQGLKSALAHEAAFRQELLLVSIMSPFAFLLGKNLLEIAFLLGLLALVLIIEIINSAIEALADAITLDKHPLIGRAKDLGSAAVFMTLTVVLVIWLIFLIRYFIF